MTRPALLALALPAVLAGAQPARADTQFQGRLEIRHYNNMPADRSTTRYELVNGKRNQTLSLSRSPRVRSGSRVTVRGRATHGRIVGALATGGSVRAATVNAGPRTTAVVLINFA